ncbi:porin family protein [Nordella sp. HKS 07]|uniref:outer membrane protein n=1 Tax=Nordella sp. HKS 07 TaxID=2712222 RepID=UPI0013E1FF1D|nr:outer membrane protein [Nordella sp. HKS 07]QIG47076.1 porin family protein [Nordella sp. HKS 07]
MPRTFLLAGAASALMICSAQAADIVEPTYYDWTGGYLGLQGGYAWGENDVGFSDLAGAVPNPPVFEGIDGDDVVMLEGDDGKIDLEGWIGGAHAGYNVQMDSFVFGLEGDIEFAGMDGDTDLFFSETDPGPIGEVKQEIDWLGSLRLRLGYAMDRSLIYLTGGLAAGGVDSEVRLLAPSVHESESDTAWGWTLGGGFEYAFTDELSGNIEYRYTDLESTEVSVDQADFGFSGKTKFDNNFNAVRVGLSWHFGGI